MITHLNKKNKPKIVNISKKKITERSAIAKGEIKFTETQHSVGGSEWPEQDIDAYPANGTDLGRSNAKWQLVCGHGVESWPIG